MKKTIPVSLILCVLLIWLAVPISASYDPVIEQDVTFVFGETVTFSLNLGGAEEPESTWLFIHPRDQGIANFQLEIQSAGENMFVLTPEKLLLKPFSAVAYWYELEYADGTEFVTDEETFYYVDNRVEWQHTGNDHFELYWQEGNHDFGAAALNIAQQAWDDLESQYKNSPETPVIAYLYPGKTELQEALALGNMNWVAGHADPQLNAVLISIAPGPEQRLEMQRQIPHELAHLFTYATLEGGYTNQPRWLLEGLASMAEAAENEDYTEALATAVRTNTLVAMEDLGNDFPSDTDEVYLAYAQSLSFTQYLQNEYGQAKLQELMAAYGEGMAFSAGFQRTYGVSLAHAQAHWQQDVFGTRAAAMVWQTLAPTLGLLFLLAVVPFAVTFFRKYFGKHSPHD